MVMKTKNPRIKRTIRIRKKIDDLGQSTIATASTLSTELKNQNLTVEISKKVGEKLGEALNEIGVKEAVFDRGGYIYHGRVQAVAEGIREKGIKF